MAEIPPGRERRPGEPGLAREEALRILLRVSEEGAWASRLLEALDERALDPRDLALTHEIVLGVLRWRAALDARIARLSSRRIERLDPAVREAFRIGAYQLLFLDRVPARAVVNGSVALARRASGRGAAGLVNAVLRKLAREVEAGGAGYGREAPVHPQTRPRDSRSADRTADPTRSELDSPGGRSEPAAHRSRDRASPAVVSRASDHAMIPTIRAPRPSEVPARPIAARLAEDLSHPEWFVARLLERFQVDEVRELLLANNRPPPVTLHPNPLHPGASRLAANLEAQGITTEPGSLAPEALRAIRGRPVRTRLFTESAFWIQDEASQVVPLLFPPPWRGLSADLCAAPGGKAFVLATGPVGEESIGEERGDDRPRLSSANALPPLGRDDGSGQVVLAERKLDAVVAFDLHRHRAIRLARAAERIAPGRIAVVAADLAGAPPVADGVFDRVLVDAPCSGTGVLRRHPEIRWRLAPDRFAALAERQEALLETSFRILRPGGWIVYSVCSIEPEEGDRVLERFLARSSGRLVDPRPHLPAQVRTAVGEDLRLRTFPHRHDSDGFFAALVQKPRTIS